MTNINKLTLSFSGQVLTAGTLQPLDAMDRIANDLGRPLKITGIQISAILFQVAKVADQRFQMKLALGSINKYQPQTNLFEWLMFLDETGTVPSTSAGNTPTVNQVIGNFKDTIFELEQFETEVQGGNAPRGEIYMNGLGINNGLKAGTVNLTATIRLYFK